MGNFVSVLVVKLILLLLVEEVVEGFSIGMGLFGGFMIIVVLFITALTLDETDTSISSKVTFSEEDSEIKWKSFIN